MDTGKNNRALCSVKVLLIVGILAGVVAASADQLAPFNDVHTVCKLIAQKTSSATDVYYPNETQYENDIYHYATSSIANATCSVEPGSAWDVGIILANIGRVPFAVKGGGHTMNPNWSSTTGVQISMTRFNGVQYDSATQTATIGAGLIWDDVYAALEADSVVTLGGRVTGVGVAGLTLGGGYSWKTNQYGLVIDTVQAYELVLPTGTVINVTEASHPDLFYALKGGFNNFGIVTKFTLKTFPQTEVWGGTLSISGDYADEVNAAIATFYENVTDPKAALIMSYAYAEGFLILEPEIFYDAPAPPAGIFDDLLSIPNEGSDISTRSYLSLIQASLSNQTANLRGRYNSMPLADLTRPLLDTVANLTEYWGAKVLASGAVIYTCSIEPFLPDILTHGGPSAYPPSRATRYLPTNLYIAWVDPTDDAAMNDATVQAAAAVTDAASAEGQNLSRAPLYANYAIYGTPLEDIYGGGLRALRALKQHYDPHDVMGHAGGWKF